MYNINYINEKLSNAKTLIRHIPIVLKKGKGIYVFDTNDKKYIDCIAAAGTLPLGHNHVVIQNAILEFINGDYPVQTMDIPTSLQIEFTKKLYEFLPKEFSDNARLQMCSPSGGDTIEAAIKLSKIATGRNNILAFQGGYHGQGFGPSSLSGKVRGSFSYSGMSDVHFLPYPNEYRCPMSIGKEGYKIIVKYIENLINNPQSGIGKPAAIILETIQGEGGVNPAPSEWLKMIREITLKNDIILIIDEVQTGFCRTGKKFGFEHSGIVPDILCLAKAIGGSMPLALMMHHKKLDKWSEYQHSGTWRGNQLAFLTGLRCMEYMEKEELWVNAEQMGRLMYNKLNDIKLNNKSIGDLRAKGLMLAIEFIDTNNKDDKIPSPEKALKLQSNCLENGLLTLRGGQFKNVIRIMPPLNITSDQVEEIINIINISIRGL
ncbi:Aminotransferase class-III [seawater metagenome]|uniref:Aminotransferase class-III n=1 Tax=seawater metagenome TaxID=1561972 RepID=A0A5E8CJY1_9ZZZZ